MTIFGPDISSYQHGLDLSRLGDASFVIAKCSEGTYYADADYPGWRTQAASLCKLFCWYHFLSGESAAAQVAHTLACVGDPKLPGMLDFEPEGDFKPTLAELLAYVDAAHAAGLNLRLVYMPRWYWQQIGSPSLSAVAARGVSLVSSAYPGGSGTAAQLYPGDSAAGWQPYGGMTPLLYQFTPSASDGGQLLDFNAFRGLLAQLSSYLQASMPTTTGGSDVELTDVLGPVSPGMAAIAPDAATQGLGQGSTFTVGAALLGTAVRQAESLILIKQIAAAVGGGASTAALASSIVSGIVPHIPPGIDQAAFTNAVVAAVEAHAPGAVDLDALAQRIDSHIQLKAV